MPTRYNRTLTELEANACKWWPENLVMLEAECCKEQWSYTRHNSK